LLAQANSAIGTMAIKSRRKRRRSILIFLAVGAFKVGEYTVNSALVMNSEKQILAVPEELAGLRLDQALARMFPEYSRSRLKEWLLAGAITVDGGPKRPRDAVLGGEMISLEPQYPPGCRLRG